MAAVDVIDGYIGALPGRGGRRLAHGEWGVTVPDSELRGVYGSG